MHAARDEVAFQLYFPVETRFQTLLKCEHLFSSILNVRSSLDQLRPPGVKAILCCEYRQIVLKIFGIVLHRINKKIKIVLTVTCSCVIEENFAKIVHFNSIHFPRNLVRQYFILKLSQVFFEGVIP